MYNAAGGDQVASGVKVLDRTGRCEMVPIIVEFLGVNCGGKRGQGSSRGVAEEPIVGAVVFPAVVVPRANATPAKIGAGGF